ncbi:SPFH domain-containing protein [Desulfonatronospira sp.]|uniref:SPFH domain-containing protein n=1 Tax=Desulfonatronospira sp. TaxID=1962951 RepID=UPI0025C317E5|nr:SPFH domain-containing protein [Desulfonatronospira sp.]
MTADNLVFLENIEWFDRTGKELLHRKPQKGSGDIKFGAQLTVRESQAAVFFYKGKAVEVFGPGRHTLVTANIPVLTKLLSMPWAFNSPLRAEVYFVNIKIFTNLKWGTRDPVAFKDSELGLVRLRAFGVFNLQVVQPLLFVNKLVGTMGMYTTEEIEEYLNRVIVSRFNDYMGDNIDSILNLPSMYDELARGLMKRLLKDFSHFGLGLTHLYVNSITPPPEVQQAIDDRSRMGVFDDMNKLMQMKAAMSMEKAAQAEGGAGQGMGMGMGLMMPAMFAQYFAAARPQPEAKEMQHPCPGCGKPVPDEARFCSHCGQQQVVFSECDNCGRNLDPDARFCSGCGHPAEKQSGPKFCTQCGSENLAESVFCNQCGEKI